jgi:hypothetical protein
MALVVDKADARRAGTAALQARADARAADLAPIVKELQASGARSLRAIAAGLNVRRISTPQRPLASNRPPCARPQKSLKLT